MSWLDRVHEVNCRARLEDVACLHGMGQAKAMEDDPTWDGESVICDHCYTAAAAWLPALSFKGAEEAVALYRESLESIRGFSMNDLIVCITRAESWAKRTPPGVRLHTSALGTQAMGIREVERRASLN